MRKLFQIAILALFVLIVSCGGGSKDPKDSCPDGYKWSGTDCVKIASDDGGDSGTVDTGTQDDSDSADDSDSGEDADTGDDDDNGTSDYNGSCTVIRNGDSYEINVETNKLTIGTVTVNNSSDIANAYGEIWAENRETLSEFKVGDVDSEFSGKTLNIPKGRYSFAYRPVSSANRVAIEGLDNVDMASGDRKLDFNLPLYRFTGKVVNNSDAVFTVEDAYQESTQLVLKTGTFEKVIPYSEFAGYDLLLPKGTYSVSFKGQLAAGQGVFEGTVLDNSHGFTVEGDIEQDIKVQTITFAGSVVKAGYAVSAGQLILVENPPLGSVSGVVVSNLSAATTYSITVTAGADLNLLYLPSEGSYPVRYIKLETWNSGTETPSAHDITLDFGRVYGKITFLGSNDFPTLANCTEADCTIGKLKAVLDGSSFVVKDLGTDLAVDEEGNVTGVTYDALLVRRNLYKYFDAEGNEKSEYIGKTYSMSFESYLNDIKGGFASLPFTVPANYTNSDGNKVNSFSFYVTEADGTKSWFTEKEIDLDVTPSKVVGKLTLNGSTFETDKDDLIKIKDESGIEHPVMNLSELSGGEFSFYAPKGAYDVIYEGEGVLSTDFKTYIERDFEIGANGNTHDFDMKTGKVTLDFNVNGTPFAEWVDDNKNMEGIGLAVNIDKTASDFVLDLSKKDGKYISEILLGSTVNVYLELDFADKIDSEKSYTRIPLLSSHNMTSGTTVKNDISLIGFSLAVKLNGNVVKASDYAAKLRMQGTYSTEIYCPAEDSVKAFFKKGEYKTPAPELYLNEGFDAKHEIPLNCLYFGE